MKKTIAIIMSIIMSVFVLLPVGTCAVDATRFITIKYNNGQTITMLNVDEATNEQVWRFNDEIQQLIDFKEGWIKKYKEQIATLKEQIEHLKENIGNVNEDEGIDITDVQILLAYYTEKNVAGKDIPNITEFAKSYEAEK